MARSLALPDGRPDSTVDATGPVPSRASAAPPPAPPRTRRNWGLVSVAVLLVAVGGLLTAWLFTRVGDTEAVLALARDVPRGAVVTDADLVIAQVNTDPALGPVPAAELAEVVGRRAAVDLSVGSLLTTAGVTDSVVPAEGQSLVGLLLDPGQVPEESLLSGDPVRIITTPALGDDPVEAAPLEMRAIVRFAQPITDALNEVETGQVSVDLVVPEQDAARLASWAATGRVAVVLDTRVTSRPEDAS